MFKFSAFQLSHESGRLHGRVAELESELRELREEGERDKDGTSLSDVQNQLSAIRAER